MISTYPLRTYPPSPEFAELLPEDNRLFLPNIINYTLPYMAKRNHKPNGSPLYWAAESWAFLSMRLFLSLQFIIAGISKFKGEDGFSFESYYNGIVKYIMGFSETTFLPKFLLWPYAHGIGYAEVIIGALVLLGVKTKYALALTGLTLVSLAFGQMLQGQQGANSVSMIAILLMMNSAALFFVRHNKLELKR